MAVFWRNLSFPMLVERSWIQHLAVSCAAYYSKVWVHLVLIDSFSMLCKLQLHMQSTKSNVIVNINASSWGTQSSSQYSHNKLMSGFCSAIKNRPAAPDLLFPCAQWMSTLPPVLLAFKRKDFIFSVLQSWYFKLHWQDYLHPQMRKSVSNPRQEFESLCDLATRHAET